MAKRFTDSRLWEKRWFRSMNTEHKLFWVFLINTCDLAGVWDVDIELAEFKLGIKIDKDKFLLDLGDKITILDEEKWMITKFISFQYGTLSESCNPHKAVLKRLSELDIKGYPKGISTLEEQEQDKDQDKEQDKKANQISKIDLEVLQSEFPLVDVKLQFESFKDWMLATGKVYRNYNAAFRNWLRRSKPGESVVKSTVKLVCPDHDKSYTVEKTNPLTTKFCPECRTTMISEHELAMRKIDAHN